jgi:hypothetical protein
MSFLNPLNRETRSSYFGLTFCFTIKIGKLQYENLKQFDVGPSIDADSL